MRINNFNLYNYCYPALIYLVFASISILRSYFTNYKLFLFFLNIIFALVWAWILNFFCSEGYEIVSWILLFIPIIMLLFFILYLQILKVRGIDFKVGMINFTQLLT